MELLESHSDVDVLNNVVVDAVEREIPAGQPRELLHATLLVSRRKDREQGRCEMNAHRQFRKRALDRRSAAARLLSQQRGPLRGVHRTNSRRETRSDFPKCVLVAGFRVLAATAQQCWRATLSITKLLKN